MNNLFLTGEEQIGKSTLLNKVLDIFDVSVGGYLTTRTFKDDVTTFTARSLYDKTSNYDIAKINIVQPCRKIYLQIFKDDLVDILELSRENRDLVVLDELGFMEENVTPFKNEVLNLLSCSTPVFGVLKDAYSPFLNEIKARDDVMIIEVDEDNRDHLDEKIVDVLKGFGLECKLD